MSAGVRILPYNGENESRKSDVPVELDDHSIDMMESKIVSNSLITLKEQLQIEFSDVKRLEAYRKMKRKLEEQEANRKLKNEIIMFKYATDHSYLRRSSPDQVWEGILRREAWRQIPIAMFTVTCVQIGICAIVMVAKSSSVNISTLVMAIMYVIAMATSNPFVITKELNTILLKLYEKFTVTKQSRIFFYSISIFLFPLIILSLLCAYIVTGILDFTTGPILDVSYGSMLNILVNIIVVFSALSIGLRSQDPINAIQTFVGFDFINNLDEIIISYIDINLLIHTKRNNKNKEKMLFIRIFIYITTMLILTGSFYLTITNNCLLFCDHNSIIL